MNLISIFLFITFPFSCFALTLEEERKYDELEGISFIRALIADKKYQEVVIQFPDIDQKKSEMSELYYHLATSHYHLKAYELAYHALEKGDHYSKFNGTLYHSLWARTASKLKRFEKCAELFKKVPQNQVLGADWELFFKCHEKSGKEREALSLAVNGQIKDPDFFLSAQRTLINRGLLLIASEKRKVYLNECRSVDYYLRLWSEVEKMKKPDLSVLESAHACHPKALEIVSHMVKAFFQEGQYHSIAYLFQNLSIEEKTYLKHTAEFYKVAGRSIVADYFFNLGEEQDYLMSRSAHFLNQENYAALLTIPLKPQYVQKNKDLSYAIAYSYFKFLHLTASKAILANVSKKNARDKQLETLLDQCKELDWKCRP